jgi:endonuclease YncB( thermonuclease family)
MVLSGLVASPAWAQASGHATALGSDTLSINGQAFRLAGVNGMNLNQSCFVDGQPLACGASATRALQILLDPSDVSCTATGTLGKGPIPAKCSGHDGDIGQHMVEQGWAIADPAQPDYAVAEAKARGKQVGVWRGVFVDPEQYRRDIAAIEVKYAQQAGEATRAEAETAITTGTGGIRVFDKFQLGTSGDGADALDSHEVSFSGFEPGFITASVQPQDIFDWKTVAHALETTRQKAVAAIEQSVADTVWPNLKDRPSQTTEAIDARTYYEAIRGSADKWIAAGRQPVLFVLAADVPSWVHDWFSGNPPTGAQVSHKPDLKDPSYLGTIDGVDVYIGTARSDASLLFPSDLLAGVSYRAGTDGKALSLRYDPAGDGDWHFQYAVALRWLDDPVIWIKYPEAAAASLHGS